MFVSNWIMPNSCWYHVHSMTTARERLIISGSPFPCTSTLVCNAILHTACGEVFVFCSVAIVSAWRLPLQDLQSTCMLARSILYFRVIPAYDKSFKGYWFVPAGQREIQSWRMRSILLIALNDRHCCIRLDLQERKYAPEGIICYSCSL